MLLNAHYVPGTGITAIRNCPSAASLQDGSYWSALLAFMPFYGFLPAESRPDCMTDRIWGE